MALLLSVVALMAGCSKKTKQVPVHGIVTLDGEPVAGALVFFYPTEDSPGQGGYARTDRDGKFEIKHELNGTGLVPGTYKATVSPGPPLMDAGAEGAPPPSKKIPGRYSDPQGTPFARISVEPGNVIKLEMESDKK